MSCQYNPMPMIRYLVWLLKGGEGLVHINVCNKLVILFSIHLSLLRTSNICVDPNRLLAAILKRGFK